MPIGVQLHKIQAWYMSFKNSGTAGERGFGGGTSELG